MNKLNYVRENPKLAYARVTPQGLSSAIYKTQAGDRWKVWDNVHLMFDGKEYGADVFIELIGRNVPMTLAGMKYTKDGHDQIFTTGSTFEMPAVGGNYGWTGNYPLYAVLANATSVLQPGSIPIVTDAPCIFLIEGWQNMGNDGGDIKAIRDLLDQYGVAIAPGGGGGSQELTINEIRSIFRMFEPVDGFQEHIQTEEEVYSHNWAQEHSDDFQNLFSGTGFGVDVLNDMKAFHANNNYTLGGGGGASGYEQTTRTYFYGSPNPMLDLRINNADAVRNGGRLKIGYNQSVMVTITGGQQNFGVNYGMAGENLSQLKSQLVQIIQNAMAPGNPLNGIVTMASPSGDNLPSWVQIHLEASNLSVWVESEGSQGGFAGSFAVRELAPRGTFCNTAWSSEFDWDVSNTIPVFDGSGGPPNCPIGVFFPLLLKDINNSPLLGGLGVGLIVVKGTNGTYAMGFDWSGDGPATNVYNLSSQTGRFRIVHDGSGNYSYEIQSGSNWITMFTTTCSLPSNWQNYDVTTKFGCVCFGLGNTPDMRINNLVISAPVDYYADAFRPLQQGIGFGYQMDRMGIKGDDGEDYKLLYGGGGNPFFTADGHINFKNRPGSDFRAFIANYDGMPMYDINGGTHQIELFAMNGTSDIVGLLMEYNDNGTIYHALYCANVDEEDSIRDTLIGYGLVYKDRVLLFQNNGSMNDYTYVGPGGIPPTPDTDPDTRWSRQRDHFAEGATDESWNELMDTPYEGKTAPTVQKEVRKQ